MRAAVGLKRTAWLLVCLLLLLSPLSARAEEASEAEELTGRCRLTWTGSEQKRLYTLTDGRINTSCTLRVGDGLAVLADGTLGTLILRCYQQKGYFLLLERGRDGWPLGIRVLQAAVALTIPLKAGCREIEIRPLGEELRVCEMLLFGPGAVPQSVPHPDAPLQRTDFLLIATHPDDEWVFLGGVYPLYGGERGYAGTVAYVTLPTWERAQECINGLWIGGLRAHPYFLGFPDVPQGATQREKNTCKPEDVTLALVRLYRQLQPLVVVTQDPENGEYGHWQHKLSANAAYDAVTLAADPAYDPASAERYGTWTVLKLYQHFARGVSNLELDVDAPLASYGGRTALEVAREAFLAHRTQLKTPFRPGAAEERRGDIRKFGLTWSALGPDTGDDLFEHIPAEALTANRASAAAAPSVETPMPIDTPEPTSTSSPVSTQPSATAPATAAPATAAPSATPIPTLTPTPGPWDRAEAGAAWAAEHAAQISAAIVLLLALILGRRLYRHLRK